MAAEVITSHRAAGSPVFDPDESKLRHAASDEVVVMEDDPRTEAYIVEALRDLGLKPHTVVNADEAVALARDAGARCFILDASMGDDRTQEGLEALTRIKKHDRSILVAVYSTHPGLLDKASRFADVTHLKSEDHFSDIAHIITQFVATPFRGLVWKKSGAPEPPFVPRPHEPGETDINKRRYRELRANAEWLKNYSGHFVAFIDGELKDADTDRRKLLARVRREHSGRPIFFTEVKEQEESVRIFSPLHLHNS